MRVVVTRPQASGQKTATLLRERGHEPVLLPLTQPIHHIETAALALAKQPQALAVTSAEAVRVLMAGNLGVSTLIQTPLFAVGSASARAAREAGFQNIIAGESDGQALADLIASSRENTSAPWSRLLYLAGTPRDEGFEKRLSALDIPFETVEAYEMTPVSWGSAQLDILFADATADAVLFYSSEAVRLFFKLLVGQPVFKQLDHCKFICISGKVLSEIPVAFRSNALASAVPSESEMFDLLDAKAGT